MEFDPVSLSVAITLPAKTGGTWFSRTPKVNTLGVKIGGLSLASKISIMTDVIPM